MSEINQVWSESLERHRATLAGQIDRILGGSVRPSGIKRKSFKTIPAEVIEEYLAEFIVDSFQTEDEQIRYRYSFEHIPLDVEVTYAPPYIIAEGQRLKRYREIPGRRQIELQKRGNATTWLGRLAIPGDAAPTYEYRFAWTEEYFNEGSDETSDLGACQPAAKDLEAFSRFAEYLSEINRSP